MWAVPNFDAIHSPWPNHTRVTIIIFLLVWVPKHSFPPRQAKTNSKERGRIEEYRIRITNTGGSEI